MTAKTLNDAIAEARRFVKRAEAVLEEAKENKYCFFGTALTGAARRASLDLTRALAEMRKS